MNVAVLVLLDLGLQGNEVAKLLGLTETEVSLERRRLGRGAPSRKSRFDWQAIQAYRDAGHTLAECQAKFGFSPGAWSCAVARGDVTTRPSAEVLARRERRDEIASLLRAGLRQVDVARRLSLSPATVAYYARGLGLSPRPHCARRYDWAEVQRYYDEGNSISACQERFGFARKTAYDAMRRGDLKTRPSKPSLDEVCVLGAARNGSNLRRRLIAEGLKEAACEACGIDSWRGVDLTFELHHVNGNRLDNRIENLRILCPNCHSQTENWGGRKLRAA